MRSSLTTTQWQRIRGYVGSLGAEAKQMLLHRLDNGWEKAVAIELGAVADGKIEKDFQGKTIFKSSSKAAALDNSLVSQVAGWLRK